MKSRSGYIAVLSVILISIGLFALFAPDHKPARVLPATVNRDCAPWDGPAFTVSIPAEDAVIHISIYRSPKVRFPVVFSFPDQTLREGNALFLLQASSPEQLTGMISFQRVNTEKPVEGQFNLFSESGEQFQGTFIARWGDQMAICG